MDGFFKDKRTSQRITGAQTFQDMLLLSFQEIESLQSMACNMLRLFHKQKISKDFRWKAALVACGTLQVLQCKCERHKKEVSVSDVYSLLEVSDIS